MKIITQARCQVQVESVNHFFVKKYTGSIYCLVLVSNLRLYVQSSVVVNEQKLELQFERLSLKSKMPNSKAVQCSFQFIFMLNCSSDSVSDCKFNHWNPNPNLGLSTRTEHELQIYKLRFDATLYIWRP